MTTPPITATAVRKSFGPAVSRAECLDEDCGWTLDGPNAAPAGAIHARAHGHPTRVERAKVVDYEPVALVEAGTVVASAEPLPDPLAAAVAGLAAAVGREAAS